MRAKTYQPKETDPICTSFAESSVKVVGEALDHSLETAAITER
jgi:hypothetical protein